MQSDLRKQEISGNFSGTRCMLLDSEAGNALVNTIIVAVAIHLFEGREGGSF
jgi:hypothetical protein